MDANDAKEALKDRIEDELAGRGITNLRRPFRCLNPQHEDSNPSMSYNAEARRVHCFACGATYDAIDLIGLDSGDTGPDGVDSGRYVDVLRRGCEKYGIDLDEPRGARAAEKSSQCGIEDERAISYLSARGISKATAKAYGLDFSPRYAVGNGRTWEALIIPTGDGSYTVRNTDATDKDRYRNKGPARLFNAQALYRSKTVHVVEGEIDALSVIEAGGAAIGLGSTSNAARLIEELERGARIAPNGFECDTLILSLDNDEAGLRTAQKLREGISRLRDEYGLSLRARTVDISEPYNDPNEAWVNDPEGFREALGRTTSRAAAEEYAATSAYAKLPAFYEGVSESANTPAIPTGYRDLDAELDGGLYEGLYIVAAITSLGKTAFVHQMADSIARAGNDVLYISLEMAETELIARSLSRLTFTTATGRGDGAAYAKSVRGITDGKRYAGYCDKEKGLILDAYNAYSTFASRVYIREGLGDITPEDVRHMVERHRDMTENVPVVFVDYMQILAPSDVRATDKQNMDKAALEMKRLSRDMKTPVVAISSLNRDNYKEAINLAALKESGALEYSSDVVIGLQLKDAGTKDAKSSQEWVDERMSEDPRKIEARILKNRNGRRGGRLNFDYYPVFNLFWDVK